MQINNLERQLEYFENEDIIEPNRWRTVLNLDITTVYQMLEMIVDLGFLVPVYEIHCKSCYKENYNIVDNIVSFNKYAYCDECNRDLSFFEDTIRLYKVINCGE